MLSATMQFSFQRTKIQALGRVSSADVDRQMKARQPACHQCASSSSTDVTGGSWYSQEVIDFLLHVNKRDAAALL